MLTRCKFRKLATFPLPAVSRWLNGRSPEMGIKLPYWIARGLHDRTSILDALTWGCVFSVYPFPLSWLREYTLCLIIIIKSEVWTIIHYLGSSHETMVCAVCFSIYLWSKWFSTHAIDTRISHRTETLSALLVLCEENPSLTDEVELFM